MKDYSTELNTPFREEITNQIIRRSKTRLP